MTGPWAPCGERSSGCSPRSLRTPGAREALLARERRGAQDHGVSRSRAWLVVVLAAVACGPSIDPEWLVTGPREIALEVEVVAQGPYGAPIVDTSRTPRDALPLDTLQLVPVVVDADGPIDAETLEGAWIMCGGVRSCLLADTLVDRPACTGQELQPSEPCRFDGGGTARLTMANLPTSLPSEGSVLELLAGPTVSFVGSTAQGPGVEACLARFDARERLDGCLMMERVLGLGPLGELVDVLRAAGFDPGIGEQADTLLARPRNRNPAVEQLRVEIGSESRVVQAGTKVIVPRDEAIVLTVETSEADLDPYDVLVGDELATLTDTITVQWWLDREVERDEPVYGQPWVRWRPGSVTGVVRAYVVLRDGREGEGWGWLDLEIAD